MARTPHQGRENGSIFGLSYKQVLLAVVLGAFLLLVAAGCRATTGASQRPSSSNTTYQGTVFNEPARGFQLTDQNERAVALADFQGRVVVLAFLDPDCTDVCPLTANQFRLTAEALGEDAPRVTFLAVNVNPSKNLVADVADATRKWGVQGLENWHYLTGSREDLEPIYKAYNVTAEGPPKPNKPNELEHTPGVYIIDRAGKIRWYVSTAFDPSIVLSELLVKHISGLLR